MSNQTEQKRQAAIEATVIRNSDGMALGLTLAFANGKRLSIRRDELTATTEAEALVHGLKQKLVDAAAISRNTDTGRPASVEDKFQAVNEVYQRLLDGAWNAPREGNGGSQSLLLAAMVRYSGKPVETVKTWLDGKTDAEKKALSLNPKVAEHINAIRAERAKVEDIDTDAMLDDLS